MADMDMGPYTKKQSFYGAIAMLVCFLFMAPCFYGLHQEKEKNYKKHKSLISRCKKEFEASGKFTSYACYEHHRPRTGCRL